MKEVFLFFLTCSFFSCKKEVKIEKRDDIFYVEDFRKPGMDDYETLMAAYESIPN